MNRTAEIPYHYGDLCAHLARPAGRTKPKTTGMILVPALAALFGLLVVFPALAVSVAAFIERDICTGLVSFAYALLYTPFAALPLISIRNFIKQQRLNCR
ncbi:MAG: hypothetical protein H6840_10140 [Planctomycetes bacterium]|nr:hypothetical protein [Planctomycetota bacterium]